MNNGISLALLLTSLVLFVGNFIFAFGKFNEHKENTFLNTFPYETCTRNKVLSLLLVLLSSLSLFTFFILSFPIEYRFGFFLAAIIASSIASIEFIVLNIVNLTNLKAHICIFCIFIASNIFSSIFYGVQTLTLFLDFGDNLALLFIGIIFIVIGVVEVLLISPLYNFSLKLEYVEENSEEIIKKTRIVRMAFYEWLFEFLLFINAILLLILLMLAI